MKAAIPINRDRLYSHVRRSVPLPRRSRAGIGAAELVPLRGSLSAAADRDGKGFNLASSPEFPFISCVVLKKGHKKSPWVIPRGCDNEGGDLLFQV